MGFILRISLISVRFPRYSYILQEEGNLLRITGRLHSLISGNSQAAMSVTFAYRHVPNNQFNKTQSSTSYSL